MPGEQEASIVRLVRARNFARNGFFVHETVTLKEALYRIAQEALNNIATHAQATVVKLSFLSWRSILMLTA